MPLFSVIIPTRDRNDLLALCLERLSAQTFKDFEVIVTDDGQSGEEVAHRFGAHYVRGPQRGPAANRNAGARKASGEWLAFTDDDCLPGAGWLAAFAREAQGRDVLEGRTHADRPRRSLAESAPLNETGGRLWSCNFAIRRELFELLGGFDERYPYAAFEDVDFAERLKAANRGWTFVPDASVCHPWRARGGREKRRQYVASAFVYRAARGGRTLPSSVDAVRGLKLLAREGVRLRGRGFWQGLAWLWADARIAFAVAATATEPPAALEKS